MGCALHTHAGTKAVWITEEGCLPQPCSHLHEAISDVSTQSPIEWEIKTCVHCWYGERKKWIWHSLDIQLFVYFSLLQSNLPFPKSSLGFSLQMCVCVRAHLLSLWDSPSFIYASSLLSAIFMTNLSFQLTYIKHDSSLKPSARSCVSEHEAPTWLPPYPPLFNTFTMRSCVASPTPWYAMQV